MTHAFAYQRNVKSLERRKNEKNLNSGKTTDSNGTVDIKVDWGQETGGYLSFKTWTFHNTIGSSKQEFFQLFHFWLEICMWWQFSLSGNWNADNITFVTCQYIFWKSKGTKKGQEMLDFHHIFYFSSFACKMYIHLCDHHCSEGSNRYPGQFFSETSSDIAQDKGDRHSLNPSYLILSTFKSILYFGFQHFQIF